MSSVKLKTSSSAVRFRLWVRQELKISWLKQITCKQVCLHSKRNYIWNLKKKNKNRITKVNSVRRMCKQVQCLTVNGYKPKLEAGKIVGEIDVVPMNIASRIIEESRVSIATTWVFRWVCFCRYEIWRAWWW